MTERRPEKRPDSIVKSEELSTEIANLMLLRGLNQSELAIRAGTSNTTVGRILNVTDPRNVRGLHFVRVEAISKPI